jgi:CHAT domain-containing protein
MATSVPAVVGTLAQVDDTLAAQLLIRFHSSYARSGDAAAALRDAQRGVLGGTDRQRADPTNWAAFEVVGGVSTSLQEH